MKSPATTYLKSLLAALLVSPALGFSQAETRAEAASEGTPVPESIGAIFDQHCKDCHHPDTDDEAPYLHSDVTLEDLVAEESLVPGDIDESPVLARVLLDDSSRKRMPRSKGKPGEETYRAPLSAAEKELLTNWVSGKGNLSHAKPGQDPGMVSKLKNILQPKAETVAKASINDDALPEGDLELQARHILNRHCQNCHNPGKRPSPDIRSSLPQMVKSGDAREMMERILLPDDDDNAMPPLDPDDPLQRRLSSEEIDVLRRWFASGEEKYEPREPVLYSQMVHEIYQDVMKNESSAPYLRYLTLANLYNAADANDVPIHSDVELETYRVAISKLMNSLSMHGNISVPEAVDEKRTIYRIDLRKYAWSSDDWERVIGYYPHGMMGVDARKESIIANYTGTRMAYVRADWFTFAASQPPLYDDILDYLLGIYSADDHGLQQRLEQRLGVDRVGNIRRGEAVRAGFLRSGVSDHNRLIERHESEYGGYWVSYDFKRVGGGPRQDLRKAPMGPPEAYIASTEERCFLHDGGEMIYALPNGMQGYLLATADGTRLDRAPSDIVRDSNRPDGTIINGISCIKCHNKGMKGAIKVPYPDGMMKWDEKKMGEPDPRSPAGMTDEIGPFVEGSRILGGTEFGLFQDLYADKEELRRLVMLDYERFNEANEKATGGFQSVFEPVSALYDAYYMEPVNARVLAAEFGMDYDEMMKLLERGSFQTEGFRTLYHSLESGAAEARDQMMQEFLPLVYLLGYQVMPFEPLGYEEFGGEEYAELMRSNPSYQAIGSYRPHTGGPGYDQIRQDFSRVKEAVTSSGMALQGQSRHSTLLPGGGSLTVEVQPVVHVGEQGKLHITSDRSIYIYVLHRGSGTDVTQFFPNDVLKDDQIISSGEYVTKTITFSTSPPAGAEFFEVYASSSPISVGAQGSPAGPFTQFEKKTFFNTRGLATALSTTNSTREKSKVPSSLVKVRVGYILK